MKAMSPKRMQIYNYIAQCVADRGYPPSVREICDEVGLSSTSTIHAHLTALEKSGYITRDTGKTRAIKLTGAAPLPGKVPLLGTVTAGQPILATEEILGYIPFDTDDGAAYFALKVRGDSMINAAILSGDIVVVRKQPTANNGEIVIALIGEEATCKRLNITRNGVWLQPENDDYEPINGNEASILGKVVAVIRTY